MTTQEPKLRAFRLYDNLYFIGDETVSVHLFDTEEGLVLIDSGFPKMYELILDNIKALGFSPENITAILHSHAHIDHFGTTARLVALSGAKTYMSEIDDDLFNGPVDLTWAKELKLDPLPPFRADVRVKDGDVFSFGRTSIRCVLTPGHTAGTLSFFVTLPDGTRAAMFGGAGMNSMTSAFLGEYGLSFDCRRAFRRGLARVENEEVDLVIGNHPGQSKTLEKMLRILDGDTDICDRNEWGRVIAGFCTLIDRLEATDPAPDAR